MQTDSQPMDRAASAVLVDAFYGAELAPDARAARTEARPAEPMRSALKSSGCEAAAGMDDGFSRLLRRRALWWHHLSNRARSPAGPGILAALAVIGMLLIFHQVVRDAVQQAEARHRAITVHAEATWRCKALRVPPMRDSCLVQLNAVPYNGATPQAGSARLNV
jgi:hypothetical protein